MWRHLILGGLSIGVVASLAGCKNCSKNRNRDPYPPPPSTGLDDPVPSRGSRIPPPSVPTSPDTLPPPVIPETKSNYRGNSSTPTDIWDPRPTRSFSDLPPAGSKPAPAPAPAPSQSNKEILLPDPLPKGSSSAAPPPAVDMPTQPKVNPKEFLEEPIKPGSPSDLPGAGNEPAKTPAPPAAATPMPSKPIENSAKTLEPPVTGSPVGLPSYAKVPGYDGVTTGRKPTLEGFDWLKANGYKTVVYLHAPGQDPTPARDLAEKRGLRFVPIAVGPATLSKALPDLDALLTDRTNRSLYVFDDDGMRAGSMWYLVFRTRELLGDDAARVRAAPLGLTDAKTDEQKQFWVAIQTYLATR